MYGFFKRARFNSTRATICGEYAYFYKLCFVESNPLSICGFKDLIFIYKHVYQDTIKIIFYNYIYVFHFYRIKII